MPIFYFLDSSALVKRYRDEAASERVSDMLAEAEQLFISRLAQVEVSAAIVRRGRATGLSAGELDAVLAALDRDVRDSFDVVELDASLIERAILLTRRHGLRAADGIQLACALLAYGQARPGQFIVMGSDQELNVAAVAEGLSVIDPTRDAAP